MCDEAAAIFWNALARFRTAQAAICAVSGGTDENDEPMTLASADLEAATLALLQTPIGMPLQIMDKFDVVEGLITHERLVGESAHVFPIIAMASLKRDLVLIQDHVLSHWKIRSRDDANARHVIRPAA